MKNLWLFTKTNWVWILLFIVIVGAGIVGIVQNFSTSQETTSPTQTKQSTKQSSSEADETPDDKHYRKAKLKLEHPYSPVSEDIKQEVSPLIDSALTFIQEHDQITEMSGNLENHLSMSDTAMIQTIWIAIHVNNYLYQSSQLEVLKSDSDDVVQVLLVFTKDDDETLYVLGNVNTTVGQFQLTTTVGGTIGATYG